MTATTVGQVLLGRAEDTHTALLFEDQSWSYRELVLAGRRRAAMFDRQARPDRPPHIGVLLENVPEYLFWLTAAAISGAVVVGINSTYRGAQLEQLVRHTDCQMVVTSAGLRPLLDGLDLGDATGHLLDIDSPEYEAGLGVDPFDRDVALGADDLFLLIFTSGSTGLPKAVRCTQGRFARTGSHVAGVIPLTPEDVVYSPLPFFHTSSLFTGWSSALTAGIPIATRRRFSASQALPDMRRYRATVLTYTGKVLNYILAVPERPDDADNALKVAMGNEASRRDIAEFARRFGCRVSDAYGSTEGIIIIRRDSAMPAGALGKPAGDSETVKVLDPDTGLECPPARFDASGKVVNLEAATGEIVETRPTSAFEGYYQNEVATSARFRGGRYWSGDLAYRDRDGWFYFAGRSNEWLRVDGENFAAAPVEHILSRHPAVRAVAVYAVPDDPVGDRVMAAIELEAGADFEPAAFDEFLTRQPDLG
ncbi:MAG TPA: AMP-binding protein, partial [Acidimicrobiales bacterium]|nr:AMP-binding protein [Acidimicrobiales bacterium]